MYINGYKNSPIQYLLKNNGGCLNGILTLSLLKEKLLKVAQGGLTTEIVGTLQIVIKHNLCLSCFVNTLVIPKHLSFRLNYKECLFIKSYTALYNTYTTKYRNALLTLINLGAYESRPKYTLCVIKNIEEIVRGFMCIPYEHKALADVWNDQHQILIIKSQGKKFTDQILQIFTIERK